MAMMLAAALIIAVAMIMAMIMTVAMIMMVVLMMVVMVATMVMMVPPQFLVIVLSANGPAGARAPNHAAAAATLAFAL